jgi:hypothetical protein
MYATLFDDPSLINEMLPRYLRVTTRAIRDVAADVLTADNRVVLTYVPERPPADEATLPAAEPSDDVVDQEVAA